MLRTSAPRCYTRPSGIPAARPGHDPDEVQATVPQRLPSVLLYPYTLKLHNKPAMIVQAAPVSLRFRSVELMSGDATRGESAVPPANRV